MGGWEGNVTQLPKIVSSHIKYVCFKFKLTFVKIRGFNSHQEEMFQSRILNQIESYVNF